MWAQVTLRLRRIRRDLESHLEPMRGEMAQGDTSLAILVLSHAVQFAIWNCPILTVDSPRRQHTRLEPMSQFYLRVLETDGVDLGSFES